MFIQKNILDMNLIKKLLILLFVILLSGCNENNNNQKKYEKELMIDKVAESDFKSFLMPVLPSLLDKLREHGLVVDESNKESIKIYIEKHKSGDIKKGTILEASVIMLGTYKEEIAEELIDLPSIIRLTFAKLDNKWNLLLFNGYVNDYSESPPDDYETPDYHRDIKLIFPNHIEFNEYIRLAGFFEVNIYE